MEHLITPPNMERPDIQAFFTAKELFSGERPDRALLSEKFGIPDDMIYLPVQEHTNRVHLLESDTAPVAADAVITARKHVLIGVLVADCVPVLLYDPSREIAGAVHAGWRGTAGRILPETIGMMRDRFGSQPADIRAAVGPSIKKCCYEVGEEVAASVKSATGAGNYSIRAGVKNYVDIALANKIQALDAGILPENLWLSGDCTFCSPGKYHSYRFAGEKAGRQGGFIVMW